MGKEVAESPGYITLMLSRKGAPVAKRILDAEVAKDVKYDEISRRLGWAFGDKKEIIVMWKDEGEVNRPKDSQLTAKSFKNPGDNELYISLIQMGRVDEEVGLIIRMFKKGAQVSFEFEAIDPKVKPSLVGVSCLED